MVLNRLIGNYDKCRCTFKAQYILRQQVVQKKKFVKKCLSLIILIKDN